MKATIKSLNALTKSVTAFADWPTFAAAMDGGYVPTLRPLPGRSKSAKQFNKDVAELADRIERLGWRVWRGSNH